MAPFPTVWDRVNQHSGAEFTTKTGRRFSYIASAGGVSMSTTNRLLPRGDFEKAFDRQPLTGPGQLPIFKGRPMCSQFSPILGSGVEAGVSTSQPPPGPDNPRSEWREACGRADDG